MSLQKFLGFRVEPFWKSGHCLGGEHLGFFDQRDPNSFRWNLRPYLAKYDGYWRRRYICATLFCADAATFNKRIAIAKSNNYTAPDDIAASDKRTYSGTNAHTNVCPNAYSVAGALDVTHRNAVNGPFASPFCQSCPDAHPNDATHRDAEHRRAVVATDPTAQFGRLSRLRLCERNLFFLEHWKLQLEQRSNHAQWQHGEDERRKCFFFLIASRNLLEYNDVNARPLKGPQDGGVNGDSDYFMYVEASSPNNPNVRKQKSRQRKQGRTEVLFEKMHQCPSF
jgi:hypothetical protein